MADVPGRPSPRRFTVHGDNIVECERAIALMAAALNTDPVPSTATPTCPAWRIASPLLDALVQTYPGHRRWSTSALDQLPTSLREAPDALLCRVEDDGTERPILAWEFCGALPAGNNAWQRSGRALALSDGGVPYLYMLELGGLELDQDRRPKAPRLPNPLVPLSFLLEARRSDTPPLLVHGLAPSAHAESRRRWARWLGTDQAIGFLRAVLLGQPTAAARDALVDLGTGVVEELVSGRPSNDLADIAHWRGLVGAFDRVAGVAAEFQHPWAKSVTIPVTDSFRALMRGCQDLSWAIGSRTMPMSVIAAADRPVLAQLVRNIYGPSARELDPWLRATGGPLVLVWVAGFKPRGDDSRPDRSASVRWPRLTWRDCADIS